MPSPFRDRPDRFGGMTLIEVLVALAIVAITLSAGFRAAGGLTVNAQRLTDLMVAQWCADNQLSAMRLSNAGLPGVGSSDFQCVQLGRQMRGTQVVGTTPNPSFRRVDTQIFDENSQPIIKLSTVVRQFNKS